MKQAPRHRARPPVRTGFDEKWVAPSEFDAKLTTPYLITMVARLQSHLYADVSQAAAFLLLELYQEEPLSHSELTKRLSIAHATVSQTLKRLEQRGLVERSIFEVDARQVRVRLTGKGREVCAPLRAEGDVLNDEIRSVLGAEREEALRKSLADLAEHFRFGQR
jgi:DNA-binding MarR family transcriptional regulator